MNAIASAVIAVAGVIAVTVLGALGKVDGQAALAVLVLLTGGAAGHALGARES